MTPKQFDKTTLIKSIFRDIFTIILLIIVWKNSHWSVALSITFINIMAEIQFLFFKKIGIIK